jgi:hypothetical protein
VGKKGVVREVACTRSHESLIGLFGCRGFALLGGLLPIRGPEGTSNTWVSRKGPAPLGEGRIYVPSWRIARGLEGA